MVILILILVMIHMHIYIYIVRDINEISLVESWVLYDAFSDLRYDTVLRRIRAVFNTLVS